MSTADGREAAGPAASYLMAGRHPAYSGMGLPDATAGQDGDTPWMMTDDREALLARLNELRIEHRDLDTVIARLATGGPSDQIHIARLKKRKLKLKDEIAWIENRLIPDIIA
jgi:hypothetical protein